MLMLNLMKMMNSDQKHDKSYLPWLPKPLSSPRPCSPDPHEWSRGEQVAAGQVRAPRQRRAHHWHQVRVERDLVAARGAVQARQSRVRPDHLLVARAVPVEHRVERRDRVPGGPRTGRLAVGGREVLLHCGEEWERGVKVWVGEVLCCEAEREVGLYERPLWRAGIGRLKADGEGEGIRDGV